MAADEIDDEDFNVRESEPNDISLTPGANADPAPEVERYIDKDIRTLYEVYSYRHAAAILANSFPEALDEIQEALRKFRLTTKIIGTPGGNESMIPKMFSESLRPAGWLEARISGDLLVRMQRYSEEIAKGKVRKIKLPEDEPKRIENFIDGHKIDYVKGRVAFDLEWNSKDQTFDRDLYAFRAFHETGLVSAGVMLTRGASLNPVFEQVELLNKDGDVMRHENGKPKSVKAKYGASTTWMGKLLYRLNAGRHGGCPILVFGITPKLIADLSKIRY